MYGTTLVICCIENEGWVNKNVGNCAISNLILLKISSNVSNWHLIDGCKFYRHRLNSFEMIKIFCRGSLFIGPLCIYIYTYIYMYIPSKANVLYIIMNMLQTLNYWKYNL